MMESMDLPPIIKTLELDKICRVCLSIKKDMRPLFGELMADMLMDCTQIQVHIESLICLNLFVIIFGFIQGGQHGRMARQNMHPMCSPSKSMSCL